MFVARQEEDITQTSEFDDKQSFLSNLSHLQVRGPISLPIHTHTHQLSAYRRTENFADVSRSDCSNTDNNVRI